MLKILNILLLSVIIGMSLSGSAFAHTDDIAGNYKLEIGWNEEPPIVGIDNKITLQVTHATDFDKNNANKMHNMMNMENYDEKIIVVLNNFDSNKINSSTALSQISGIINKQNLDDDTGKEIKNLIDDINSRIITDEDALYALIDMLGTELLHKMSSEHNTKNEDDVSGKGVDNLSDDLSMKITIRAKTIPLNLKETKFSGVYEAKFMPSITGYPVVHVTGNISQTPVDITFHPEEIESLSILRPLIQIENGINPADVQCKNNLELFMWIQTESAVCVSSENGQKLLELGVVDYF